MGSASGFDGDVNGTRASGEFTFEPVRTDVVRVGRKAYVLLSAAYLQQGAGTDYPRAWTGRWMLNEDGLQAAPGVLTADELDAIFTPAGPVTGRKDPSSAGTETLELSFRNKDGNTVKLQVAADEPHHPVHADITTAGKLSGSIDMDQFGRNCQIDAPTDVVRTPP